MRWHSKRESQDDSKSDDHPKLHPFVLRSRDCLGHLDYLGLPLLVQTLILGALLRQGVALAAEPVLGHDRRVHLLDLG